MKALKPQDCDILIFKAIKDNDLEAAVALYEPTAAFVLNSGETVRGTDAIRDVLRGFMALEEAQFTTELTAFINPEESLALVRGAWSAIARSPDGLPVVVTGKNAEVVRRQPDGTWKFVIDHPGVGVA